jgi:nucleoside transporter
VGSVIKLRLSAMMFIEFFVWGGWFVTMGSYLASNLSATGAQSGMAYSTQSWGAIIAPFIIGLIADRYVNAERLLGLIHLIGAVLLYLLSRSTSFDAFYPYLLAYMVLFMSTLALVNSISFRQMEDPSKHFSKIRVWGTIGWIVAGLVISYGFHWDAAESMKAGALKNTFFMCAVASALLGAYSFTLPATPPLAQKTASVSDMLGADALGLLRDRNFLVFVVASVLICIPLAFYYQAANLFLTESGVVQAAAKQTIGQAAEVIFMLFVPFFLRRFGMKGTLLLGMAAWAIRYVLFAYGNAGALQWMLLLGIALHGMCYDFFFVSGQIYTDSKAGEKYKSAAQGMITLATYGLGMLIGFWAAGRITDQFALAGGGHDWHSIWIYPAVFAAGVFVLFGLVFRNERVSYKPT